MSMPSGMHLHMHALSPMTLTGHMAVFVLGLCQTSSSFIHIYLAARRRSTASIRGLPLPIATATAATASCCRHRFLRNTNCNFFLPFTSRSRSCSRGSSSGCRSGEVNRVRRCSRRSIRATGKRLWGVISAMFFGSRTHGLQQHIVLFIFQ